MNDEEKKDTLRASQLREYGKGVAKNPNEPTKVRRIYDLLMGVRSNLGRVCVLAGSIDERLLGKTPETVAEAPQPELCFLDGVISSLSEFSSDLNGIAKRLEKIEAELKD